MTAISDVLGFLFLFFCGFNCFCFFFQKAKQTNVWCKATKTHGLFFKVQKGPAEPKQKGNKLTTQAKQTKKTQNQCKNKKVNTMIIAILFLGNAQRKLQVILVPLIALMECVYCVWMITHHFMKGLTVIYAKVSDLFFWLFVFFLSMLA